MIQALLVDVEATQTQWKRLETYFDCLYLAGPRLWARILPGIPEGEWNGDIGDLFRSFYTSNSKCIDGWESGFLLRNCFASVPDGAEAFRCLLNRFLVEEQAELKGFVLEFMAGES